MSKPTPQAKIESHAALVAVVTLAIADALRDGMAPSDVASVLTRLAELLEEEE